MTDQLKAISLSDISLIKNYRDVEPPSEKDEDVIELSKSIVKLGVMQPVLLREHPDQPGKYQLIFGHRRFMACKVAKLQEIPATIKEVADEDILELQVTENLQRKDVHPMDEAVAFQSLMRKKGYKIDEISARFAKKPEFITQRLKLNDLIDDLQKDFKHGKMLLGHALQICRLGHDDQGKLKKNVHNRHDGYGTISDLQDYIERHIIHKLSSAPFKREDLTLNPSAGACTNCPKRSGANPLLFPDIKEEDRCFDAHCFDIKLQAFSLGKVKEVLETSPDILLLADHHNTVPKPIAALAKGMKVKILVEYQDFNTSNYSYKKKIQGIWVNGSDIGKVVTAYVKGPEKAAKSAKGTKPAELGSAEIDSLISGIKEREKRAKELDLEKVHKTTLDEVNKLKDLKAPGLKHQGVVDRGIMVFLLLQMADSGAASHADDVIAKNLKNLPKEPSLGDKAYHQEYIKKLGAITDGQLAFIVRTICLGMYGNRNLVYGLKPEDTTLRLMAEYTGIDVKAIEDAQGEIATKRQERVAKRIKDLQAAKKEKVTSGKGGKAKAASKKAVKAKTKPVSANEEDEE